MPEWKQFIVTSSNQNKRNRESECADWQSAEQKQEALEKRYSISSGRGGGGYQFQERYFQKVTIHSNLKDRDSEQKSKSDEGWKTIGQQYEKNEKIET